MRAIIILIIAAILGFFGYQYFANDKAPGDKVKITLRFRGREMAHQELGRNLLERVAEDTKEAGRVENFPKMEGRQMVMLIGPMPK
uniref:translation initiation factor IF-3 n=1 Tax=Yoonia sp. TaxID=2212373 RepID=UPI004047C14A